MKYFAVVLLLCLLVRPAFAGDNAGKALNLSVTEYYTKVEALEPLRKERQVSMKQIADMLRDKNTILLDARGDDAFRRIHILGAKHLSYADMTVDNLAKMLPAKHTRVIVYCDVAIMNPLTRMMPLSAQAFADLNLYGYDNVYEMRSIMSIKPLQAQCKELMDIPFGGDARAVTEAKQSALQCLSFH